MVGESGISDAGNEARDVEEVVDFGEVSVGEGVASEPAEDTARGEGAGGEDSFGDFARGSVVPEEDDAFLGEYGVDEDDDGVRVGAVGGEMRVQHEWLGRGGVGGGKGLDELYEGEVADCFGGDGCGDFYGNGDLVVDYSRFELVGVARDCVSRAVLGEV